MEAVQARWHEWNEAWPKGFGFAEVLVVIVLYIVVPKTVFSVLAGFNPFTGVFEGQEGVVARSFTLGAITQLLFLAVMIFVFHSRHARDSLKTLRREAPRQGWLIAGAIVAIEVGTIVLFFLPEPAVLFQISLFSLAMAAIPALDGLTQEVVFRGYLLRRMDAVGFGKGFQIFMSGLAFGALHFNYGGAGGGLMEQMIPALGTFGLGAALAFACQASDYKILPVVTAHVLIILILQPWLALASMA